MSNSYSSSYSSSYGYYTKYKDGKVDDDIHGMDMKVDGISDDLELGDESSAIGKVFVHQLVYTASQPVHADEGYMEADMETADVSDML
eukprot:TRINITY_DN11702_c0_g1_i1.p1 TRINITY_DN11702_c0_g1~~TRINITY_DN11702_c0_g1_i1.p1  ORF type:complete len:103 (-),score=34.09 TRINITY_DN11702_c0_g1_i1:39-302(-)